MELSHTAQDGVGIIHLRGHLNAESSRALRSIIQELLDGSPRLVLDMQEVDFIDSTGLGVVVGGLKAAVEKGGNLYIAGLQRKPRMVFEITRAHRYFRVFATVEEATAAYSA